MDTVSNEAFRDAMRPFADTLSQWAVEWNAQPERHGFLPTADSAAMRELAQQDRWATDDWLEPVRNAHTFGHMLCYLLGEHLSALAQVTIAEVGPTYSPLPIVRAVIEATTLGHWLLDPQITAANRVRRSTAYRLDSANQLGRLQHLEEARQLAATNRAACRAFAATHNWKVADKEVGGQRLPHPDRHFSRVVFGDSADFLDKSLWGFTSAAQHGTWYALAYAIERAELKPQVGDDLGGIAPIVVSVQALYTWGVACFMGCDAVARARDDLFGWQRSASMHEAEGRLHQVRRTLAEHRRHERELEEMP